MRIDKEQAVVLRKTGMSYSEISAKLGVARSTLSSWFREQKWSNDIAIECMRRSKNAAAIKLTVLNTIRGNKLNKIYEESRQDALVDYNELKYHPLFLAGIFLYWSHGNKTSRSRISLSTTDFAVAKMFRLFLQNVCQFKKIRAQLLINSQDYSKNEEFLTLWRTHVGFSGDQFLKSSTINVKNAANKPHYGVCNIIANSAYLKNKILRWIELAAAELGDENYNAGIV